MITTKNPYTEETLETYSEFTASKIEVALKSSEHVFKTWKNNSFQKRSKVLKKISKLLKRDEADLAKLITQEMGKPISQSVSEIKKCAWVCDYYADESSHFLESRLIKNSDYHVSKVVYRPLGVIYAIMPWNYPFWQVFRFAAPTLMAGNVCLLKHSANVTGCALKIQELFQEAGEMEGLFQTLVISHDDSEKIISDFRIKAVSLTGSSDAGKKIASQAGKALKKTVLELGGSDPYLILADADLEVAAKKCIQSRMLNSGQSCISAKRFIVDQKVKEEFLKLLEKEMESYIPQNPMSEACNFGPMARKDLRDDLAAQVKQSIHKGAVKSFELKIEADHGFFYSPTILENVKAGMPAFSQELFGPVASVMDFQNLEEAIRIANSTVFGLGSAIFSKDLEKAMNIAENLVESGACFVNDFVKSDPRLPFGGINESGYGRELSSNGIREFVNIKTVCSQET